MPIAIAGMHRSGTSMVARLLNLCGVSLGDEKDLTFVAEDNPEGFWEHSKFHSLNEEILASFNGSWDMPPSLPSDWKNSIRLMAITRNAKLVIEEMSHYPVWGWKDPRNSLTIAYWKRLIPDLRIVICLRNPIDVYHSL